MYHPKPGNASHNASRLCPTTEAYTNRERIIPSCWKPNPAAMWGVLSCLFHSGSCQVNMYFLSASDKPRKRVDPSEASVSLSVNERLTLDGRLVLAGHLGVCSSEELTFSNPLEEKMLSPTPKPSPCPQVQIPTHQVPSPNPHGGRLKKMCVFHRQSTPLKHLWGRV